MLKAVHEALTKETELVVDAVAEAGIVERRQRIEKARREAAEASVAERGIGLERLQFLQIDAELHDDRLRLVVELEIRQVVAEKAAHEELHGQVMQALRVLIPVAALALAHRIEARPAHCDRERLETFLRRRLPPDPPLREAKVRFDSFAQVNRRAAGDIRECSLHHR